MAPMRWTAAGMVALLVAGTLPVDARDLVAGLGAPVVTPDLPVLPPAPVENNRPTPFSVLEMQADIALAGHEDSVAKARLLRAAITALVNKPSLETLAAARVAWRVARIPFQQTEVFRFGDPEMQEWRRRVSGWPITPGFLDYVEDPGGAGSDAVANPLALANVIANPRVETPQGIIDATEITPSLLANQLQGAGGISNNMATGFHVIEFLLWGEDDPGFRAGEGRRGLEDFSSGPHADRRVAYLLAATDLLVNDLETMVDAWRPGGAARARFVEGGLDAAVRRMMDLSSIGLATGWLSRDLSIGGAGSEPDSFSASTHVSYLMTGVGIRSAYIGKYVRMDGRIVEGPSLSGLVAIEDEALDAAVVDLLQSSVGALVAVSSRAQLQETYRQQLSAGNPAGNAVVRDAVAALLAQSAGLEQVLSLIGTPR